MPARTIAQRLEDATALAEVASSKMGLFIDGPDTDTIPSATGPIPTLKKYIKDLGQETDGLVGVVQAQVDQVMPASELTLTYDGDLLASATETTQGGARVTTYQYEAGKLTSSIEVYKNRTRTSTYLYDGTGKISSITKEDAFA